MYLITIYDDHRDNVGTVIQSPYVDGLKLSYGEIKQVTQGIPNFKFDINPTSPAWGRIKPLKTLIRVVNAKTGKEEFAGRILMITQSMDVEGMLHIRYACEGFLAYLQDSNQRHGEYRNVPPREFLQIILDNHNRQVDPHKRMKLGEVTVTNSTDNLQRYLGYEKTYETIKEKLIDRLGGYIKLRKEPDGFYIDYLESVGEVKNEPIRLQRNLKDMQRDIDPTNVVTRVVPLGARIESKDPEAIDASQARLTIAEANNGIDYLDDLELQDEFGIVEDTITFDDIYTPSILKLRGDQFLEAQRAAKVSYRVTAVDLSLINQGVDSFEIDNYYPISNPLFTIDEQLQIIEKTIDVTNAKNFYLVIGDRHITLTEYQVQANKKSRQIVELQSEVDGQRRVITNIRTEMKTVEDSLEDLQRAIENADLPEILEAIDNLNQAVNTLIDAIDEIPIYEPATPTQDGLMSSSDKSKLNLLTVTATTNLDALRTKLNRITVTNPVNLDNMASDVQALMNEVFPNAR